MFIRVRLRLSIAAVPAVGQDEDYRVYRAPETIRFERHCADAETHRVQAYADLESEDGRARVLVLNRVGSSVRRREPRSIAAPDANDAPRAGERERGRILGEQCPRPVAGNRQAEVRVALDDEGVACLASFSWFACVMESSAVPEAARCRKV